MVRYTKITNELITKYLVSYNDILLFSWTNDLGLVVDYDEERYPNEVAKLFVEMVLCDSLQIYPDNEFGIEWENLQS